MAPLHAYDRLDVLRHRGAWLAWLVLLLVVAGFVLTGNRRSVSIEYRRAAQHWLAASPLYNDAGGGFLYLPSAAVASIPFAILPLTVGETLWRLLTIGVFAIGVWRLSQGSTAGTPGNRFLFVTLVALPLAFTCARNGQSTLLMGGLMMLAAADLGDQRWNRCAVWLSLAIAIKPLAIVLALLAVAIDRRLWWRMGIGLVVVLALPFLFQRPDYVLGQYRDCLQMLSIASQKGQAAHWAQLFGMLEVFGVRTPATVQTMLRGMFALATLGVARIAWNRMPRHDACQLLYRLSASYLMLFNPRTENSTYALMGPAVGLLLAELIWRHRSYKEAAIALTCGIAMLGSFEIGKHFVPREQAIWLAPLATVAFAGLLLAQLRRLVRQSTPRSTIPDRLEIRDVSSRYELSPELASRLTWAFVALGLLARCVRYFLKFPLWEDEAFLCVNLLDRGFAELQEPLVYGQVAPLGFLAAQLSMVKLLGFHELSLRLLSFVSGIGSLLLFTHLARQWLRGMPQVLAVAMFAVAYPCIRYSAEAKPYGSDLFLALMLLALAWRYWHATDRWRRIGWFSGLCFAVPMAMGFSYPAVFVAGGISLTWLWWMNKRCATDWLAWCVFNGLTLVSFAAVYVLVMRVQMQSQLSFMQDFWQTTFPPWNTPWKLPAWLAMAHTSDLVAYPAGGGRGGSTATFVLLAVGVGVLLKARRWSFVLLCLAPLALTFVAASLRLYPYGGSVRLNIYMAPAFCVLAGLGAAHLIQAATRQRWGGYSFQVAAGVLALVGVASIGRDAVQPYKALSDHRARAFAQWFWFNASRDGEVACAITDLRQNFAPDLYDRLNWTAEYLCNQRIYSPRHSSQTELSWDKISVEHPLRCVVYRDELTSFDAARRDRWMQLMQTQFELVGQEVFPLVRMDKRERHVLATDHVEIYKFIPRRNAQIRPILGDAARL